MKCTAITLSTVMRPKHLVLAVKSTVVVLFCTISEHLDG